MADDQKWDLEADVVVLGSGGATLKAALGEAYGGAGGTLGPVMTFAASSAGMWVRTFRTHKARPRLTATAASSPYP
jgi:hypothetical protein